DAEPGLSAPSGLQPATAGTVRRHYPGSPGGGRYRRRPDSLLRSEARPGYLAFGIRANAREPGGAFEPRVPGGWLADDEGGTGVGVAGLRRQPGLRRSRSPGGAHLFE